MDDSALELVDYGNGHAWLRRDAGPRFILTELGRRALAEAAALEPGPTIADVTRGGIN